MLMTISDVDDYFTQIFLFSPIIAGRLKDHNWGNGALVLLSEPTH